MGLTKQALFCRLFAMKSFAGTLKRIRLLRGYTQQALARRSGIDPTQLSHFERSMRMPNMKNVLKLADALEISTDCLLGRTEQLVPTYRDEHRATRLASVCENLTAQKFEALIAMAKAIKEA